MDTKKLRQKILDLAIRGKLVPQDPVCHKGQVSDIYHKPVRAMSAMGNSLRSLRLTDYKYATGTGYFNT